MKTETIRKYNHFRHHCLRNAEEFLKGAERHHGVGENHILFHLSVLALEEIGKIFLGWVQLRNRDDGKPLPGMLDMEDHVRKLFWAIWGPSFMGEGFSPEQWKDYQGLATDLHELRLLSLYTGLDDAVPNSGKITDQQAEKIYSFTIAHLELAKMDGELMEENPSLPDLLYEKFLELTTVPQRRSFIFGADAQVKMIELADLRAWIRWLVEHFEAEAARLDLLMKQELARHPSAGTNFVPKWRVTVRFYTPTHTIRNSVNSIQAGYAPYIRLRALKDPSLLEVDIDLDQVVLITQVYHSARMTSQLFVAALNIATTGLFWWQVQTDPDKYYEKIVDLESNTALSARLSGGSNWEWSQRKVPFKEEHVERTHFIFTYLCARLPSGRFEPLEHYLTGLAMLAKTDFHLYLGVDAFLQFYNAFRKALAVHESPDPDQDIKTYGYAPLRRLVPDQATFDALMDKAAEMLRHPPTGVQPVTLNDVVLMKSYCGWYFFTLAARFLKSDPALLLTVLEDDPADGQQ